MTSVAKKLPTVSEAHKASIRNLHPKESSESKVTGVPLKCNEDNVQNRTVKHEAAKAEKRKSDNHQLIMQAELQGKPQLGENLLDKSNLEDEDTMNR